MKKKRKEKREERKETRGKGVGEKRRGLREGEICKRGERTEL
jgi:hypothetical protein